MPLSHKQRDEAKKALLRWCATVEGDEPNTKGFGGSQLATALSAAVPLWMMQFKNYTEGQRRVELDRISESDLCLRMEYVLHRGPKPGDTARAFNDLARAIALLSFCPGGVKVFGVRYE